MLLPLLVSLALPFQGSGATVAATPPRGQSRVAVRLSDSSFARGQRARVYVELGDTAYLLVLHVNGDGRIRILFPLRPVEDALVPGGRWYEIPGPDGREAIAVDERAGSGTVLAARWGVPFRFTLLASGDEWDYDRALLFQPTGGDPLAAALDIVERLADPGRAEVDVTTYAVHASEGATSHVAAAGAATEPGAIWPSVRSSPYPGGGDQATDAPATVIINAVCANSYVAEGAVCGSVLYNPTVIQSVPENPPYLDTDPVGRYYPDHEPFFFLLFSHRVRMIERPAPPLPPRPAQALPRPPRPSRVRVIKPALPQYPPLPPPRRPIPGAAIGARIRAPASGEAPRMAAVRPPMTSVSRPMPAAWTRRRAAPPGGGVAVAATAAPAVTPVVRRSAGSNLVAPVAGARPSSPGTTRNVSQVPLGVSMGSRPPATGRPATASPVATRPTARAFPHPIRTVRPRTP